MNAHQITLVQTTFDYVRPVADTAAAVFYNRLFELDPSLRKLFHANIAEQGKKLMAALAFVVANLNRPDAILPAVQELGRRHAGYGVEAGHYATVGAALLWTLDAALGDLFTFEAREAWTSAYTLLATVMQEAAQLEAVAG
jgi:hemoglobin-like flavoprotein